MILCLVAQALEAVMYMWFRLSVSALQLKLCNAVVKIKIYSSMLRDVYVIYVSFALVFLFELQENQDCELGFP